MNIVYHLPFDLIYIIKQYVIFKPTYLNKIINAVDTWCINEYEALFI